MCKKKADDLYSYDITKTGNAEEIQNAGSKNLYCVIFSADTGAQIYNTIMNGNCIGDTVYVTGNKIENPKDSQKTDTEAAWEEPSGMWSAEGYYFNIKSSRYSSCRRYNRCNTFS